ncbi:MAG: hypothetical protein LBD10_14340 [Desulfobulbus sp.]|jgi:hypothetical protein|uniref:SDH family Clp fold serine proteinase n=1 Tax=Desulfobulbus sp. TaxID=895 RepID=UPI00284990D6|nr:hypothetical protein [Desulfobulbus sp.]MDR2551370.1 hypothetical protein [Desulfobulbus sp.]
MSDEIKIKEPPILFNETQSIIKKLEEIFNAPVICYWNNPRGSICASDVIVLYEILGKIGNHEEIYLFVKSDGGNGKASLRFVSLLRQYCRKLTALVPLECSSAATMIALGADEIQMGPMAHLSAVDTSITHDLSPIDRDNDRVSVSLDELNRVIKLWSKENKENKNPYQYLFEYVHPLVIGAVDRAESLSIMLCKEILSYHMKDEKKSNDISETLNSKYPSHGYPILLNEAQKLGLNAQFMDKEIHQMLLNLSNLYSEMGQKATTDFSEIRAHSNEILNILESSNMQVFFQQDKNWFYRAEERRWITMNDESSWRKNEMIDGAMKTSILHIA